MDADLDLALSAAERLARQYRVVDDDDLQRVLPGVPRPVRHKALDRLANDRVLRRRHGHIDGYDSAVYAGAM
jgi:RIO-like serine/threonine protein kinase